MIWLLDKAIGAIDWVRDLGSWRWTMRGEYRVPSSVWYYVDRPLLHLQNGLVAVCCWLEDVWGKRD